MVSHSATSTYILGAVLLLPLLPLYIKQILSFLPAQWELGRLTYFVSKPSELELDWFTSMAKEYDLACPDQLFRPYIFTFDPLIIYLENYISHRETRYLVELA
jgi:hypothetical protein